MFQRWRERKKNREIVDRLYEGLVARARRPRLFEEAGLPDTVMGRYEAISLEVFLFLRRCRRDERLAPLAQDLVDRFMTDLDHSLREIGIGYQGVPKRMRKLATRFYTRVKDFETPMETRDETALAQALSRRAYPETTPPEGGPRIVARYMLDADAAYASVPAEAFLSGSLDGQGIEQNAA